IEGLRLMNCEFVCCSLSVTTEIERRTTVRDVELVRCASNGCHLGPAIFEDVRVDGLETNTLLILWGPLFNRVTLAGTIGEMKVNQDISATDRSAATQARFDAFREEYYRSVDWALDISGARFRDEFEFRGIPARLVRRDPESQAVVTRERLLAAGDSWRRRVSASNDLWPFAIDLFLSDGDEDMVLVAPLAAPKRKRDEMLRGLQELRDLGVAEPD
ncbi:MAG TPA: hypothetical protein VF170_15065, partial [Planctomycetaceae bacterium]